MKKIKIGLIGFGYMGRMHSMSYDNLKYYYKNIPEVSVYAVSATEPELAALPMPVCKTYPNWQDLVADPEVDVIDICAPNHLHVEMLCAAIHAGKPIYCEKPLSAELSSAKQVMDAIKETGYNQTNRISFIYRFIPAVMRARQLLDEGAIGKLVQFNMRYYGSEFIDPARPISWQSTKAMSGGGVLYALGTHSLDLIRHLVGETDSVFALQNTHFKQRPVAGSSEMAKVDIEDILNIQLDCGGVPGTLLLSQVATGASVDLTFELYGEKGAIKFDHANPNYIHYYNNELPKEPIGGFGGWQMIETSQKFGGDAVFPPPRVNIAVPRYHMASIYDFVHAVAEGRSTTPNLLDGFRVQELTDAIYASAEKREIVQVQKGAY